MAISREALGLAPEPIVTPAADGDGVIVDFPGGEPMAPAPPMIDYTTNIAALMTEDELKAIYSDLVEKIDDDARSRESWDQIAKKAIKLLGLEIRDGKVDTGKGISQATDTLMLETCLTWQATVFSETMPMDGPARGVSKLTPPPGTPQQALAQADAAVRRAEAYFNFLLTKQIASYVPQHDRNLFNVGLLGCGFKKIYPDATKPEGFCIEMIQPEDMIVSYFADGTHGRVTHVTNMTEGRMADMVMAGTYLDAVGTGELPTGKSEVTQARDEALGQDTDSTVDQIYVMKECVDDLVLPKDPSPIGRARPYMVCLDTTTQSVRAIFRQFKDDDPSEKRLRRIVNYNLLPGNSMVYGWGFAHMLGNTAYASQDALRRSLDAALFANHPAGFKHSSLDIRDESRPLDAGEFRDVDAPTGNVAQSFAPLPFKGPDPSLIELRRDLREDGRRLAGQAQLNIAETMTGNTPVGTAVAALEEAGRIPGSIQRRIYHAMMDELAIIREVLLDTMQPGVEVTYGNGQTVTKEDILVTDFEPAMRPGAPTQTHRIVEAQALLQLATQFPQLYDLKAVCLVFMRAIGVEEPEALFTPEAETPQPADAVTELSNALAGKGVKAGLSQDHDSHITSHAAQMQMLALQPALGEAAGAASAALQANIAEHFAMKIMVATAMQLGIPLEQMANGMPPELEMQIAPMVAQAMQQILAQMPKPEDPGNTQVQVAQIREQGAMAREQMKIGSAEKIAGVKAQVDIVTDQSDTGRNNADNSTALALAQVKEMMRPAPQAPSNDRDMDPKAFPQ